MTALRLQTGGKQQIFPASLGVEVGCVCVEGGGVVVVGEGGVRGESRKTIEETGKGNQMTALRFQTGGINIRHPRPPFRGFT